MVLATNHDMQADKWQVTILNNTLNRKIACDKINVYNSFFAGSSGNRKPSCGGNT